MMTGMNRTDMDGNDTVGPETHGRTNERTQLDRIKHNGRKHIVGPDDGKTTAKKNDGAGDRR